MKSITIEFVYKLKKIRRVQKSFCGYFPRLVERRDGCCDITSGREREVLCSKAMY